MSAAVDLIATRYPRIDTVNVPDLATCELRSVDAVEHIRDRVAHRIPHLRACDFDESSAIGLIALLDARGIDEVIVVAGDRRPDTPRGGFEPGAMIRFLAAHAPHLSVYAALDPHRYRDDAALAANIEQKRAAGACGIFYATAVRSGRSRPLRAVARAMRPPSGASARWSPIAASVIGSVSTVCSFRPEFAPSLNWNQAFALRFLSEVAERGGNAYLMPIKVDIERYLAPLEARFARAAP